MRHGSSPLSFVQQNPFPSPFMPSEVEPLSLDRSLEVSLTAHLLAAQPVTGAERQGPPREGSIYPVHPCGMMVGGFLLAAT